MSADLAAALTFVTAFLSLWTALLQFIDVATEGELSKKNLIPELALKKN